jgi:hypothetical protein
MDRTLILCIAIIALITAIVYVCARKESFPHVGVPVDMPDGTYNIISVSGKPLASTAFTPIQCKQFLFSQSIPSSETAWNIKRVAHGIFMLKKPGDQECMYTSPDNSVRSYVMNGSCASKSLCGLDKPTETGDLDERSLHTYYMILQHPNGKYYIKSMSNDLFLCMKDTLSMTNEPTEECLFTFQSA